MRLSILALMFIPVPVDAMRMVPFVGVSVPHNTSSPISLDFEHPMSGEGLPVRYIADNGRLAADRVSTLNSSVAQMNGKQNPVIDGVAGVIGLPARLFGQSVEQVVRPVLEAVGAMVGQIFSVRLVAEWTPDVLKQYSSDTSRAVMRVGAHFAWSIPLVVASVFVWMVGGFKGVVSFVGGTMSGIVFAGLYLVCVILRVPFDALTKGAHELKWKRALYKVEPFNTGLWLGHSGRRVMVRWARTGGPIQSISAGTLLVTCGVVQKTLDTVFTVACCPIIAFDEAMTERSFVPKWMERYLSSVDPVAMQKSGILGKIFRGNRGQTQDLSALPDKESANIPTQAPPQQTIDEPNSQEIRDEVDEPETGWTCCCTTETMSAIQADLEEMEQMIDEKTQELKEVEGVCLRSRSALTVAVARVHRVLSKAADRVPVEDVLEYFHQLTTNHLKEIVLVYQNSTESKGDGMPKLVIDSYTDLAALGIAMGKFRKILDDAIPAIVEFLGKDVKEDLKGRLNTPDPEFKPDKDEAGFWLGLMNECALLLWQLGDVGGDKQIVTAFKKSFEAAVARGSKEGDGAKQTPKQPLLRAKTAPVLGSAKEDNESTPAQQPAEPEYTIFPSVSPLVTFGVLGLLIATKGRMHPYAALDLQEHEAEQKRKVLEFLVKAKSNMERQVSGLK